MLVCIDGSKQSKKAVEEAVTIAGGCNVNEVAIIYVYENKFVMPEWSGIEESLSRQEIEQLKKAREQDKVKSKEVLLEAKQVFEKNNIKANTIFKEGHPAQIIINEANEEGYDMVVLGSRGLGGLKKLFLGSVSNAVVQEAKPNVLVVK